MYVYVYIYIYICRQSKGCRSLAKPGPLAAKEDKPRRQEH